MDLGPADPNPLWPDAMLVPFSPRPFLPLAMSQCIGSYQELVDLLGNNTVRASAVVLENAVAIPIGPDLAALTYTATGEKTGSSLFTSKLAVVWRRPGDVWQTHTSEVWSLGCVFNPAPYGPLTNLKKGNQVIGINTSIYWGGMPYQGLHIKYIVLP